MSNLPYEIGSEFQLTAMPSGTHHVLDNGSRVFLRAGRDALRYVARIAAAARKDVLMPSLCCESMPQAFELCGYHVIYYRIGKDLSADLDDLEQKARDHPGGLLLSPSYYGQASIANSDLLALRAKYEVVIVKDATHDWLDYDWRADEASDFTIASLRKWMPLPDGAFLFARAGGLRPVEDVDYTFVGGRERAMRNKARYLKTGIAAIKRKYMHELQACNASLDSSDDIKGMSDTSRMLFEGTDLVWLKAKREANAQALSQGLFSLGVKHIYHSSATQIYLPIILDPRCRDRVQRELASQGVFCPVLWPLPSADAELFPEAVNFVDSMLALPCDQRYGVEDMNFIVNRLDWALSGGVRY